MAQRRAPQPPHWIVKGSPANLSRGRIFMLLYGSGLLFDERKHTQHGLLLPSSRFGLNPFRSPEFDTNFNGIESTCLEAKQSHNISSLQSCQKPSETPCSRSIASALNQLVGTPTTTRLVRVQAARYHIPRTNDHSNDRHLIFTRYKRNKLERRNHRQSRETNQHTSIPPHQFLVLEEVIMVHLHACAVSGHLLDAVVCGVGLAPSLIEQKMKQLT